MKIGFRQGIIRCALAGGLPNYLLLNSAGSYVTLEVNSANAYKGVFITFADGDKNYLYEEKAQIVNAWGPISGSKTTYLYWDIDQATGMITRRTTDVPPVLFGPQPSNPVINQHWFDDVSNTMRMWNGVRWNKVLRVFGGKVESKRISYNLKECINIPYLKAKYQLSGISNDSIKDGFTFNIIGSHSGTPYKISQFSPSIIGANTAAAVTSISNIAANKSHAGFIMYGMDKKAVKELSTGTFITSDTSMSLNFGTFTSPIKLETSNTFFKASEYMGKFSLIAFTDEGKIALADRRKQLWAAGIISHDVHEGEEVLVEHSGMIYNENWNLPDEYIGKTIYLDTNGTFIAEIPPGLVAQKIGIVTANNSILLTPDLVGPIGKPDEDELPRASVDTLGFVKLSVDAEDSRNPIVVGTNDARMSDARVPLAHTHEIDDINLLQDILDNKVDMITGGDVKGTLTVLNPLNDGEAANKRYVDNELKGLKLSCAPLSDITPLQPQLIGDAGVGVEAARNDHVHPLPDDVQYHGTQSGLMSVADKKKLDDLGPATNVLKQTDLGITVAPLDNNLKLDSKYLIPVNDTDNGAMTPAQKKKLDDLGNADDVIKTQDIGTKVTGLVPSLDDPNKLIINPNNFPETINPLSNYNSGLMSKADKIILDNLAKLDDGNGDFGNVLLEADIGNLVPELVNGKIPTSRIDNATPTSDGLLSKEDKQKIDDLGNTLTDLASDSIPLIDGIASAGIDDKLARADHVHPLTPNATPTSDGLLSKEDKQKIDAMEELTDLLGTVTPLKSIDTVGDVGISDKLAREDHIHPLPDNATPTSDGLLSKEDKQKIDDLGNTLTDLASDSIPLIDGIASAGIDDKLARADHVHPLTPNATPTSDGLLSKEDKQKIDAMEELTDLLGTVTPLKSIDNNGFVGISDKLAREDHVHPLPNLATITEDGLLSKDDKQKLDNLSTLAGNVSGVLTTTDIGVKIPALVSGKVPLLQLPEATISSNGIITAADKVKIDNAILLSDRASKTSPNAVASLENGKVPVDQLPAIAINDIHVVATEPDLLTLTTAKQGDVGVVTGSSKSFILKDLSYGSASSWVELLSPLSPVSSVAGKIGAVTLQISDITNLQTELSNKLNKANDTATNLTVNTINAKDGYVEKTELRNTKVRSMAITMSSTTVTIDASVAEYFKVTAPATGNITINISNLQASGFVSVIVIECINFGGRTVNWPTGTQWAGGSSPAFTATGKDIVSVIIDGTTIKAGLTLGKDVK